MIFAQASDLPAPDNFASVGWVVVIITSLILSLRAGIGFVRDLKDKPAPGEVRAEAVDRFASKTEVKELREHNAEEHRDIFARIGGVDRGMGKKISDELSAVHTRVNGLEKSVGGLEAATTFQNQSLAQMQADIKRILENMPRK